MPEVLTEDIRIRKGSIHCSGCEATIERFLSRIPGVQVVKASEASQAVRVTWEPEVLGIDEVRVKLDELGYPAEH